MVNILHCLPTEKKKEFIQFKVPEIFEVPLFGSDDMDAYFHVLSSVILFKKWTRTLQQDSSRSLSMLTKCVENNQEWE